MSKNAAKDIEITGCGDETFFKELMILLLMDLGSGFIFVEQSAKDRSHKTWDKLTSHWVSLFKKMRCFVSDRARALIKLGEQACSSVSIADLFHLMKDISSTMCFAFSRKIKSLGKLITEESEKLKLYQGKSDPNYEASQQKIAKPTEEKTLQRCYQNELQAISTTLHPFSIKDSSPQTSENVALKMHANLARIKNIKERFNFPDKKSRLNRAKHQISHAPEQVDLWWGWVRTSLDGIDIDDEEKQWLKHCLLPCIYWKKQIRKTRSKKIKQSYCVAYRQAERTLASHPLSKTMAYDLNSVWYQWASSISDLFQRTSSAAKGRNSWLSQLYFMGKGFSKEGVQVQTTLHNYWIKRNDGTTACERLTGIKPPDLFEYILSRIDALPEPRKWKQPESHKSLNLQAVPP